MTSGAGEVIDEAAASARTALRAVARRLPEIVVGLGVLLTLLAGLALVGAALDDRGIDANRGIAIAAVLDGSSFGRTLIAFSLTDGQLVVPKRGVFYPRGTTPGQTILVEYDTTDPDLVRAAGHSGVDGLAPVGAGLLAGWAVLGPLALWLRRRRRA